MLAAPLFSNPGLLRTGLRSIRSDTVLVDRYMSRYDVTGARAILVGHANYDHLMDVPRVALSHAPNARIVGVVEDVVQARAQQGPRPAAYFPYTQSEWPFI